MNWFFLRMLEHKAVEALLRSPMFHRGVQSVHKKVHQMQHGKPPEHYGGTNLDAPQVNSDFKKLANLFWEELKTGHKGQGPVGGKK